MKALDLSFSAPDVTSAWCAARLADGYELLICCLWTGIEQIQGSAAALRNWREAGGKTAGYVAVHDGRPASEHVAAAQLAALSEWAHLSFVAVDVEVDTTSVETVLAACDLIAKSGQRPIIYTGKWFWDGHMSDPQNCTQYPLWDAHYGIPPSLDAPGYGGWLARVGHQHTDDVVLDGITCDLNLFDTSFVNGSSAGEAGGADLTEAQVQIILALFNREWGRVAGTPEEDAVHGAIVAAKTKMNIQDRLV